MEDIPNIRHLSAFAAVMKHGSATRAAEVVNLTQPALTQAIAKLEVRLGTPLFAREPSGMRPTEAALLLGPRAETALTLIGSRRVTATQIRAFVALARHGSYSAASEHVGLAAASLHRAVGDLAQALGERLVERRGRHLALTRKGETRARNFGLALAELRSGFAEVSDWLGNAGGAIVIGAMPLSRARWLPRSILKFQARISNVDIKVIEGSYGELAGPLRNGEIDFLLGALREDAKGDDLEGRQVFIDFPKIIARSGHPIASSDSELPHALSDFPWVLPAPHTPLHHYWQKLMESFGGRGKVSLECGSVLTMRELLLETDLLTLLSPAQVRIELQAGLLVAIDPPTPVLRPIGITQRRDWRPTSSQQSMLDILETEALELS
ncbi:MAG: LysR family transcriptional regulator [Erythrobacter sp.]